MIGGWNTLLVVMERSGSSKLRQYELIVSISRARLLAKITRHCEEGYEFVALVGLWGGMLGVIMERTDPADAPGGSSACGPGRFEIVKNVGLSMLSKPLSKLDEPLEEMSSKGYRLLAATAYEYGGLLGALLFEKATDATGHYEYVIPDWGWTSSDGLSKVNALGAEGFRLHPFSDWFPIMEKKPGGGASVEYGTIGPGEDSELLDAVGAAVDDGFRVLMLLGDKSVVLERERNAPTAR